MARVLDSTFATQFSNIPPDIDKLLKFCTENDCSDLFVKVGEPPYAFRYGVLYQSLRAIDEVEWDRFTTAAINSESHTKYVRNKFVDFSYQLGSYRYRGNAGFAGKKNICTFRMISDRLPTFESLHLDDCIPKMLSKSLSQKNGITMLVGVTGSGKTSTLAACINSFSAKTGTDDRLPLKDANLITMEDPIEYTYPSTSGTRIVQKELGQDFESFDLGIKSAMREHPTHMLVGETRDIETINALVQASRTGHATITTFHTHSVADTVARLYSYLSADNQDVMYDLIDNLNFVLAQELVKGRTGYTLRYQYLYFDYQIKEVLLQAIAKNRNIPEVINQLMKHEKLLKAGLAKDWNF